jgi:hypothetical protein
MNISYFKILNHHRGYQLVLQDITSRKGNSSNRH